MMISHFLITSCLVFSSFLFNSHILHHHGHHHTTSSPQETVKRSPALSILQLFQCACVNDNGIAELVSVINPRLRGFEASHLPHITSAAIQKLSEHCRELQHVKFVSCRRLNRGCLQALGDNCRTLRSVSFLRENRSDDGFLEDGDDDDGDYKCAGSALVTTKTSSRTQSGLIDLSCTWDLDTAAFVGFDDLNDAALIHLSKHFCSSVIDLDLSASCDITDQGLRSLATKCRHLQSLALSNTFITDKGVHYLADNCPRLRRLDVSGCQNITEVGLAELVGKCPELETLTACGCTGVCDIRNIIQECNTNSCSLLQELDVRDTSITEIPESLSSEIKPDLKILYSGSSSSDSSMCKELSSHPHTPDFAANGEADCKLLADDDECGLLGNRNITYRRRVLVLGDAGSGKTTIVNSLRSGGATNGDVGGADADGGISADKLKDQNGGLDIRYICPFKDSSESKLQYSFFFFFNFCMFLFL